MADHIHTQRMKGHLAAHEMMTEIHDNLIAEHEKLWLVRLGLSFFSIRHHQIIGASRAFKVFDRKLVAENTRLWEEANGEKWVKSRHMATA